MRTTLPCLLTGLLLLPLADAAPGARGNADEGVTVFKGARIHTAAGAPIDNGVLVVRGGKVVAVGPAAEVQVPDGATVRDVTGQVIIPDLVGPHLHIRI